MRRHVWQSQTGRRAQRVALGLAAALLGLTTAPHAGERAAIKVRTLTRDVGAPQTPRNVKLALLLPEAICQSLPHLGPQHFTVHVFPAHLSDAQGLRPENAASGIMLWRYKQAVFLDVRQPPTQEHAGEYAVLVRCVNGDVELARARGSATVRYVSDKVDVVLVIDSSMSMLRSDPQRKRIAAAQAFLEMAARGGNIGQVGIVSFNNQAQILARLTPIAQRESLLAALKLVRNEGQTNMDRALRSAQDVLRGGHSPRRAIVFLTDGRNEPSRYEQTHLELASQAVPIFAVGLSDRADHKLLERMASDTGGRAFKAASDRDLLAIYQRIASELGRRVTLLAEKVRGQAVDFSVPIDDSVRSVDLVFDAEAGHGRMELQDPAGQPVVAGRRASGGMVSLLAEKDYQMARVLTPTPGAWNVALSADEGAGSRNLTVTVDSDLYLDLFPPQLAGRRMHLAATLAQGPKPVPGARVRLLDSGGRVPLVELFDDGQHGDGRAGDGVFAGWIDLPSMLAGKLNVELRAWGKTVKGETFVRQSGGSLEGIEPAPEEPGPEMAARLVGGAIDLGLRLPGDTAAGEAEITLIAKHDLPLAVRVEDLQSGEGERILGGLVRVEPGNKALVSPGKSRTAVRLQVPATAAPGEYRGCIHLSAGEAKTVIQLTLVVPRVALGLDTNQVDFGRLLPGRRAETSLRLGLDAPRNLRLGWQLDGPVAPFLAIARNADKPLEVGPDNALPVKLRVPLDAKPGNYAGTVHLRAGPAMVDLVVRLHVLARPAEEIPQAQFDIPVPEVARLPEPELPEPPPDLGDTEDEQPGDSGTTLTIEPAVVPATVDSGEAYKELEPFLLWALFLLFLLLVLLVLIVRMCVKNRMARFALGSVLVNCLLLILFVSILAPNAFRRAVKKPQLAATLVGIKKDLGLSLSQAERELLQKVQALDNKEKRFVEEKRTLKREADRPDAPIAAVRPSETPQMVSRRVAWEHRHREELKRKPLEVRRRTELAPEVKRVQQKVKTEQTVERRAEEAKPLELARASIPKPQPERRLAPLPAPKMDVETKKREVRLSRLQRQPRRTPALERRVPDMPRMTPVMDEPAEPAPVPKPEPIRRPQAAPAPAAPPAADTRELVTRQDVKSALRPTVQRRPAVSTTTGTLESLPIVAERVSLDVFRTQRKAAVLPSTRESLPQPEMVDKAPRAPKRPQAPVSAQRSSLTRDEPREVMTMAPRQPLSSRSATKTNTVRLQRPRQPVWREADVDTLPRLARTGPHLAHARSPSPPALKPAPVVPEAPAPSRVPRATPAERMRRLAAGESGLPPVDEAPDRLDFSPNEAVLGARRTITKALDAMQPAPLARPEVDVSNSRVTPTLAHMTRDLEERPTARPSLADAPAVDPVGPKAPRRTAAARTGARTPAEPLARLEQRGELGLPTGGGRPTEPVADSLPRASLVSTPSIKNMRVALRPRRESLPNRAGSGDARARLNTSTEPGSLSIVVGEVQFGSDWDSSPLAVANLLDAFRRRVAGSVKVEKRTVHLTPKAVADCQLLFMTGNLPFTFTAAELRALKGYLAAGGCLWVNDSTREGDEAFDQAFRREIRRVTDLPLKRLPRSHAILRAGYDFSKGVRGYRVPPGDKYRVDYLEGIEMGNRLAVLYTRNDYADGMALDPTLNPMRKSLTDLAAEEMQEISIRFGINVIAYTLGGDSPNLQAPNEGLAPSLAAVDTAKVKLWQDFTGLTPETLIWKPESWGNPAVVSLAPDGTGGEALRVDLKPGPKHKVAIKYDVPAHEGRRLDLTKVKSILVDFYNGYHGGFRFSLVVTTVGPNNDWHDFETKSVYLRPGWNRNLRFVLQGANFKSRETGWRAYDTPLKYPASCGKIAFFIYNGDRIATSITVDNVRFESE